jgi:hypothetical protein
MSDPEKTTRRPRGKSAIGNFETAKRFAVESENARVAADRRKTEALRAARLQRDRDTRRETTAKAVP